MDRRGRQLRRRSHPPAERFGGRRSAQEQIGKLQGLLARIQRNAGKPRVVGSPTSVVAAPPTPHDSVDDLLAVAAPAPAPTPSPPPVEVDVQLESVPPAEEAIPLVAVTSPQPAPVDDSLGLDSEVSEVRVTTATREPAAEVTVAAIEAEAEPIAPEELSEDDLVEVTEATSVPPPVTSDVDIDFEDEDEQPPASSQRSKVASTMDEALAAAAAQLEAEREVPLKTPPPESGPQAAPLPAGISAPAAPDVDALLGGELDIPTHTEAAVAVAPAAAGPTTEQLGQTIDLEEARGPALELAEQKLESAPAPAPVEELEVALPGRDAGGGYHEALQPPPEARDDLAAHRRRLEDEAMAASPESLAQLPSVQPAPEVVPASPEIVARPLPVGSPESFSAPRETFRPSSFVELLDASLSLSGD
jgi:hypothetical protein